MRPDSTSYGICDPISFFLKLAAQWAAPHRFCYARSGERVPRQTKSSGASTASLLTDRITGTGFLAHLGSPQAQHRRHCKQEKRKQAAVGLHAMAEWDSMRISGWIIPAMHAHGSPRHGCMQEVRQQWALRKLRLLLRTTAVQVA